MKRYSKRPLTPDLKESLNRLLITLKKSKVSKIEKMMEIRFKGRSQGERLKEESGTHKNVTI